MKNIKIASMNPEVVAEEIGEFIVRKTIELGKKGAILGLSGGVDSTTVAALAKRAFDKNNFKNPGDNLELVGYLLPSNTNNPADLEDGLKVAKRLGIRYEIVNIEPFVEAYGKIDSKTFNSKFHKGNLMSEIRALVLHRKSASENKILLGTGNRDEDFGVGYYTLFGDGAVHISPIGELPKRLVRQMAIYLGFEDLANRVPTAGLEPGQTDFKDLGYYYETVELISEAIRQGFFREEILTHHQILDFIKKDFENYEKLFGVEARKFKVSRELIEDVLRRNKDAQNKAKLIHPEAPEVSLEYE